MNNNTPQLTGSITTLYLAQSHQEQPKNEDFENQMRHQNLAVWDFCYDEIKCFQEHIYFTTDEQTSIRLFVDEKSGNRWIELQGKEAEYFKRELSVTLKITDKPIVQKKEQNNKQETEGFNLFSPSTWFKKT